MEVHTHAHPPSGGTRKKWTHYFWEFLMLFLAVFCGFLAENKREHMVEHQREKKYMASLVEDLETDTAALQKAIRKSDSTARYSDSVLIFLSHHTISATVPVRISVLIGIGGQRLSLINTDRTSSQLKNSGAMRLIREKEVSDAILRYWKQIDEGNINLDRYNTYRNAGRELVFKLWVVPVIYRKGLSMPEDSIQQLRVIDPDPKKWDELANLIAISGQIARVYHTNNLVKQLDMAVQLIALIKKEYHLK